MTQCINWLCTIHANGLIKNLSQLKTMWFGKPRGCQIKSFKSCSNLEGQWHTMTLHLQIRCHWVYVLYCNTARQKKNPENISHLAKNKEHSAFYHVCMLLSLNMLLLRVYFKSNTSKFKLNFTFNFIYILYSWVNL